MAQQFPLSTHRGNCWTPKHKAASCVTVGEINLKLHMYACTFVCPSILASLYTSFFTYITHFVYTHILQQNAYLFSRYYIVCCSLTFLLVFPTLPADLSPTMLLPSVFTFSSAATSSCQPCRLLLAIQIEFLATSLAASTLLCRALLSRCTESYPSYQNSGKWWTGCLLTRFLICSTGFVCRRFMPKCTL